MKRNLLQNIKLFSLSSSSLRMNSNNWRLPTDLKIQIVKFLLIIFSYISIITMNLFLTAGLSTIQVKGDLKVMQKINQNFSKNF